MIAARWASVVQLSSMSSHAGPICGIWRKWSITHSVSKPAASDRRAMSRSRSPSSLGPPGQVNWGSCRSEAQARASRRRRPGSATDIDIVGGTSATRCSLTRTWWASNGRAARPGERSATRRAGGAAPRPGTRSGRARLRRRTSAAGVSNMTAMHGTPASRAAASHRARRAASVPSVSTTVVSRRRSRAVDDVGRARRTRHATRARSCAPSPTMARSASLDTTCAERCVAAHVDLPDPAAPTRTTRHGDGSSTGPR